MSDLLALQGLRLLRLADESLAPFKAIGRSEGGSIWTCDGEDIQGRCSSILGICAGRFNSAASQNRLFQFRAFRQLHADLYRSCVERLSSMTRPKIFYVLSRFRKTWVSQSSFNGQLLLLWAMERMFDKYRAPLWVTGTAELMAHPSSASDHESGSEDLVNNS